MAEEKPTSYILDASFMLSFLLPDEQIEEVAAIFDRYQTGQINFISTPLLPFEVINGLKYAIKSHRINIKTANNLIGDFYIYRIVFIEANLEEILFVSLEQDLTVYDAAYLSLAKSQNLLLLTLDKKLMKLA